MVRKLCILVAILILFSANASAQALDARKVLEASAKAMGAVNLETIQYSADGWFSMMGPPFGPPRSLFLPHRPSRV